MSTQQPQNIVLIGFMGVGKTTIGKLLAKKLGFRFTDTDARIVKQAGHPIPKIFAEEGEEGFRERETAALNSLANLQHTIIATGGGVITREENLPLLKKLGYVVWLTAEEDDIYHRVTANSERPLMQTDNPRETIRELLAVRDPLYSKACHLRVDTTGFHSEEIAYGVRESALVHFAGLNRPPAPTT